MDGQYTPREAEDSFREYYAAQEDIWCRIARLNALSATFDTLVSQGYVPEYWDADGISASDLNRDGEWVLEFLPAHDLSFVA